jgi:hypothetical protein
MSSKVREVPEIMGASSVREGVGACHSLMIACNRGLMDLDLETRNGRKSMLCYILNVDTLSVSV